MIFSSGNKIVDEVSMLNINSIPETWYHTIRKNNQPYALAILILWEFVYWYKWTEVKDENTGLLIGYKRKFKAVDYLQKNYDQLGTKFGISKKVSMEAVKFLCELGVIAKHLRKVPTQEGTIPNVMFIELIPSVLKKLSFPKTNTDESVNKENTKQEGGECPNGKSPVAQKVGTNTTNTTTIISTNTTRSLYSDSNESSFAETPKKIANEGEGFPKDEPAKRKRKTSKKESTHLFSEELYKTVFDAYRSNFFKKKPDGNPWLAKYKDRVDERLSELFDIHKGDDTSQYLDEAIKICSDVIDNGFKDGYVASTNYMFNAIFGPSNFGRFMNGPVKNVEGKINTFESSNNTRDNYNEEW